MNDAILQHNSDDDPLKPFYGIVDRCLRNTPLIILGSGASIDYGFPSMKQLGDEIKKRISAMAIPSNEKTAWDVFVKNFDECGDFEKSLDQLEKLDCNFLRSQVIQKTWEIISDIDRDYYKKILEASILSPLSQLLEKLARGNTKSLKIVTTNYDRIAEYSAEMAEFHHYTGFNYGHIRQWDDQIRLMPLTVARRIVRNNDALSPNNKMVDIWKVHGSIDWFKINGTMKIMALPHPLSLDEKLIPLIVTPGTLKYQTTSSEPPFHVILEEAKRSIEESKSYLCLGYGFNDSHIQPNLVAKLQNQRSNVPTVVLAKELTAKGRDIFLNNKISNFIIFEEAKNGTRIYTPEHLDGEIIALKDLWQLDTFIKSFRKE